MKAYLRKLLREDERALVALYEKHVDTYLEQLAHARENLRRIDQRVRRRHERAHASANTSGKKAASRRHGRAQHSGGRIER